MYLYDFLSCDFFSSVNFDQVTYRQAISFLYDFLSRDFFSGVNFDQVTDRRIAMHMSPPCIRTGGLKNYNPYLFGPEPHGMIHFNAHFPDLVS